MAAIVAPSDGVDLKHFLKAAKTQLPSYALPMFIRISKELDMTGEIELFSWFRIFLSLAVSPFRP